MMFTPGDKNYKNKNSGCDVLTFETHERPDILRKLKKIKFMFTFQFFYNVLIIKMYTICIYLYIIILYYYPIIFIFSFL
jgi:hypothetical protein